MLDISVFYPRRQGKWGFRCSSLYVSFMNMYSTIPKEFFWLLHSYEFSWTLQVPSFLKYNI